MDDTISFYKVYEFKPIQQGFLIFSAFWAQQQFYILKAF